jgi:hypothetical protein
MIRFNGKSEIIDSARHRKEKVGCVLFFLSKMAIRKHGGKRRDFKKNRNCEVVFCLQKAVFILKSA